MGETYKYTSVTITNIPDEYVVVQLSQHIVWCPVYHFNFSFPYFQVIYAYLRINYDFKDPIFDYTVTITNGCFDSMTQPRGLLKRSKQDKNMGGTLSTGMLMIILLCIIYSESNTLS